MILICNQVRLIARFPIKISIPKDEIGLLLRGDESPLRKRSDPLFATSWLNG